jgi:cell division control protein 7
MTMVDTKYYLKALLTALKHLHSHRILHRDIKPNNFLYNMEMKTGMLIDFGLAQVNKNNTNKYKNPFL